jgi:hypothetical protein
MCVLVQIGLAVNVIVMLWKLTLSISVNQLITELLLGSLVGCGCCIVASAFPWFVTASAEVSGYEYKFLFLCKTGRKKE